MDKAGEMRYNGRNETGLAGEGAMDTINQKNIKVQNMLQVCDVIFSKDNLSRYEISQDTGISIMTVGKVVEFLKQAGVVSEVKDDSSTVGRKAGKICCRGDQWNVVLMDLYHEQMEFSRMPICGGKPELMLAYSCISGSFEETFREALEQLREVTVKSFGRLAGIGVLVPGPYYADKDSVINRRIPQLTGFPLQSILREYFPDLPIIIEEDVKFAARCAIRQVKDYETKTIFYAYVGEGVGGAIIQNAENFQSAHSYSADFGQFKLSGGVTAESLISLKRFREEFPDLYAGKQNRPDMEQKLEDYVHEMQKVLVQCFEYVMWLIDPDIILFDSEYDCFLPDFFPQLSEIYNAQVSSERGEDAPLLIHAHAGENMLYEGARNSVRGLFLQHLV